MLLSRECVASLTLKIKQNLNEMSSVLSVSNIPINHISGTVEAIFQRLILSQMFEDKQISIWCCGKKSSELMFKNTFSQSVMWISKSQRSGLNVLSKMLFKKIILS